MTAVLKGNNLFVLGNEKLTMLRSHVHPDNCSAVFLHAADWTVDTMWLKVVTHGNIVP